LRRYQLFGFFALLLLVGGVGGWAYTAKIAGAIIAQATVVVESNSKEVQHLEGGIVAQLNVRDGDRVEAGEVLIRLDDTDTKAGLEIINIQLYELLTLKARLEAERDLAENIIFPEELLELSEVEWIARIIAGQRNLFVSRRDFRARQIEQLKNRETQSREEIVGLNAQLASQNKQMELIREEMQGVLTLLESDLVTVSRLKGMERQIASIEGEIGQLKATIARVNSQIVETELQIIQISQDLQTSVLEELRQIQPRIAELYERRLSASANLRRVDIVAPQGGFVHELQVNGKGSVIGPGQVIMLIVPGEDSLVLNAQVNPQDMEQISIGQQVVVNLPAFTSGGVTPSLAGSVYRIAADLTQDNSTAVPPFYAVRIEFLPGEIDTLGTQGLKPGMPAEAYIQTNTRTALSYILKPFTDQLNRAFRE
ncbi:MAG: HlyD family type I secretion periplasmic adaptor subunit, partial [Devosiaceae bacterium]|nr:HlyD family type I secretion periplasmic adaptor subunit [Devosiaceae bacterium]